MSGPAEGIYRRRVRVAALGYLIVCLGFVFVSTCRFARALTRYEAAEFGDWYMDVCIRDTDIRVPRVVSVSRGTRMPPSFYLHRLAAHAYFSAAVQVQMLRTNAAGFLRIFRDPVAVDAAPTRGGPPGAPIAAAPARGRDLVLSGPPSWRDAVKFRLRRLNRWIVDNGYWFRLIAALGRSVRLLAYGRVSPSTQAVWLSNFAAMNILPQREVLLTSVLIAHIIAQHLTWQQTLSSACQGVTSLAVWAASADQSRTRKPSPCG